MKEFDFDGKELNSATKELNSESANVWQTELDLVRKVD